jgi:hypothetical protein
VSMIVWVGRWGSTGLRPGSCRQIATFLGSCPSLERKSSVVLRCFMQFRDVIEIVD